MEIQRQGMKAAGALALLAAAATLGAAPASAAILSYGATLAGANEVPGNASPATGSVTVTIDDVLDTLRVQAGASGLTGTTSAAHIHCCAAPGANAPVATFTGFPLGVTSFTFDQTYDMTLTSSFRAGFITDHGGTPATAFDALLTGLNARQAYFNVHTSTFPGGEIRGNLAPLAVAVDEPGSAAALAAALAALALASRRGRASGRRRG